MKNQLNIFGTEKITVAESIDLTIASMKEYELRRLETRSIRRG